MKGSINSLLSVLMLLVAIPAIYACTCKVQTLEFYWCANSTAVIKGRVLSEAHIDASGKPSTDQTGSIKKRYRVREDTVYKSGPTVISKVNSNFFEMYVSTEDNTCAVTFTTQKDYLLLGSVDKKGRFLTNGCFPSRPWANVTADPTTMTLLNGQRSANCSSIN